MLSTALAAMLGFHCIYFGAGPTEAAKILAHRAKDKLHYFFRPDPLCAEIRAKLMADGCGELREMGKKKTLKLKKVVRAGRAYDNTDTFLAFYKGRFGAVCILVYFAGQKLQLHGLCSDEIAECVYQRATPVRTSEMVAPTSSLGNFMPAILLGTANEIGTSDAQMVKQVGPAAKMDVAEKLDKFEPVAAKKVIIDEKSVAPAFIQSWIGTWSGDGMSVKIGYSSGKIKVGKLPAQLNNGQLTYLENTKFGTPIWVKMIQYDEQIIASMESQYGELLKSATLSK